MHPSRVLLKIVAQIMFMGSFLLGATRPAPARDWPQWRGPFLNGSTDETGLPATWTPASAKWAIDLPGEGGSTPIVCGDRIFLTSTNRQDKKTLHALCLDRRTGRELWRKSFAGRDRKAPYNRDASPSPATDGRRTIFLFGTGLLTALDNDGKTLWERNLEAELGPLSNTFIYSASPLLYRDRLYLAVLRNADTNEAPGYDKSHTGLESCLLCLDPATGRDLWKTPRPTDAYGVECRDGYATPYPWETPDGGAAIVTVAADFVTGHDWQSGKELWRLRYSQPGGYRQRVVPTPVEAGGLLLASKPRRGPIMALRPGLQGAVSTSTLAWEFTAKATDTPSILYYRGRAYFIQEQDKTLTCLDPATGKVIWSGKLGGTTLFFASPTGADGKNYCMDYSGEVVVAEAGDRLKLVGRVRMGGVANASTIVAAHGALFIRTEKKLFCIAK